MFMEQFPLGIAPLFYYGRDSLLIFIMSCLFNAFVAFFFFLKYLLKFCYFFLYKYAVLLLFCWKKVNF